MNITFCTHNHLGDTFLSTALIRDLKEQMPDIQIDFLSNYQPVFENNPNITKHGDLKNIVKLEYHPFSQRNASGGNLFNGWRESFEIFSGLKIHPGPDEIDVYYKGYEKERLFDEDYIVINAGNQSCSTIKTYPFWQEIVNDLKGDIKIIQIGGSEKRDRHVSIDGAVNLIGKTTIRDLMRIVRDARAVISPPSAVSILATQKDFRGINVIINGTREPNMLTQYKNSLHFGNVCCKNFDKKNGCMKFYVDNPLSMKSCYTTKTINGTKYPLCMCVDPKQITEAIKNRL